MKEENYELNWRNWWKWSKLRKMINSSCPFCQKYNYIRVDCKNPNKLKKWKEKTKMTNKEEGKKERRKYDEFNLEATSSF